MESFFIGICKPLEYDIVYYFRNKSSKFSDYKQNYMMSNSSTYLFWKQWQWAWEEEHFWVLRMLRGI